VAPSSAPSVLDRIPEEPAKSPTKVQFDITSVASSSRAEEPAPPAYTPPEEKPITLSEKPRRPLHLKTVSAGTGLPLLRSLSADALAFSPEGLTGGILEKAWLQKMAEGVARKVEMEREKSSEGSRGNGKQREVERAQVDAVDAPPAYVS